jgi:hypothetical protein
MQIEFHSHEQQDEFVFNLLGKTKNGFFLDIACGNPIIGSNTYTLEKFCGWQGICIDIENMRRNFQWSTVRKANFIQLDATSDHLTTYLKTTLDPEKVIDYISIDVDTAGRDASGQEWVLNSSFVVLQKILKAGVRFKTLTIEHEFYRYGDAISKPSRELLESLGYIRLFEDVKLINYGADARNDSYFEDWWIDPRFFDVSIIQSGRSKMYYHDCIEHLKSITSNEYEAVHNCSKAWPHEYRYFWSESEKEALQAQLSQQGI